MSNIFRPGEGGAFQARQAAKRYKQQYWAMPILHNRGNPPGDPRQSTLIKIWQHLHYLSSHSPVSVAVRHRNAARRFEAHHLANRRGSPRFVNKYTAHRWL